jgi:RNA polymerase sigma factor (sigma-70 family)
MDDNVKTFRITAKLRNNRLIKLREALGLSCPQAAAKIGIQYTELNRLEGLKVSPINHRRGREYGTWTKTAKKVAAWYKAAPEWIWPDEVHYVRLTETNIEIDLPQVWLDAPRTPEQLMASAEEVAKMEEAIASDALTDRERIVLQMRSGLEGEPKKLDDIGRILGVSRERIRQIDLTAQAKLRARLAKMGVEGQDGDR